MKCNLWLLVIAVLCALVCCVCLGFAAFYNEDHAFDSTIKGLLGGAIASGAVLLIAILLADDNGVQQALICISGICALVSTVLSVWFATNNQTYENAKPGICVGFGFSIASIILLLVAKCRTCAIEDQRAQIQTHQVVPTTAKPQGKTARR